MKNISAIILSLLAAVFVVSSCADDSYTTSPSNLLSFSEDTIRLDTTFSTVGTPTHSFWVYNRSGDGIRCANIKLEKGNQTGYRINVDGTYLGPTEGYQVFNVEIPNKDSIRVFVELTSPVGLTDEPRMIEDNIVFSLESGVEQKVKLETYAWNATIFRGGISVERDTTIASEKPVVIYKGITVAEGATLTIAPSTTLYFHADAGIDVAGRLLCKGEAGREIVLRGDRIDHMFDYLPYDRVSGQWRGIHLLETSYDNHIAFTDIHSTFDGIVADSSDVARDKLILESSTIHNCQGYGLIAHNSRVTVNNCQLTNTLGDCIAIYGGWALINSSTFAQFYPFDANRGVAMRFTSTEGPLLSFICQNSIVTGYADDQLMGESEDSLVAFNYYFDHCLLRTPKIETADSVFLTDVIYENAEDTTIGSWKNFVNIDTDNLIYDFRLSEKSLAIGKANPLTSADNDRQGKKRKATPDIGAYETDEKEEAGENEQSQ